MSRLNNLYLFLNDEKGRTLPRAKLFFYENNSFDFKNTYADKALTSINPNPVIADGAGRFPNIFLEPNTYRVVLQDEDGVEISTKDDVDNLISDGDDISNTTVTTSTGPQTLAGALDDRVVGVSVQRFGADPTGAEDSTAALRSAISSGLALDWGYNAVYSITDDIGQDKVYDTEELYWQGHNVTIRNDSASQIQNMCRVVLSGSRGYVGRITFDCNNMATRGLSIENNSADMSDANTSDLVLDMTRAINIRRASDTDVGGEGLFIRGGFSQVALVRVSVENVALAAGAGVSGIAGVTGVTVTHFGLTGYVRKCVVHDVAVNKVYSEDNTYVDDQDGIKVFAPHVASGGIPLDTYLEVVGGSYRNCWGRSIKSQMFENAVNGSKFYRNEGFLNKEGNSEIAFQVSGGSVNDIQCFYENDYRPGDVVSYGSGDSGGTPYGLSSLKVTGVKVNLSNFTLPIVSLVSTFPDDGYVGPVSVSRCDVFGGALVQLVNHRINGDRITNRVDVRECYVDELIADGVTGNKALVRVISSGVDTPFRGLSFVYDCVFGGTGDAYLMEDGVAGNAASSILSSARNLGFVNDNTERLGRGSGPESVQADRIGRIAPAFSGTADARVGSHNIQSKPVASGATETFSTRAAGGCLYLMQISANRNSNALFAADGGGTVSIFSGSTVVLGNTADPGSGTYRAWMSAIDEITVSNTDGSTRWFTIWELTPGS